MLTNCSETASMDSSNDADSENREELQWVSTMIQQTLENISTAEILCTFNDTDIIKLQAELTTLKEKLRLAKQKEIKTKRTRWCSWCLQEAIFMGKNDRFYCCTKCEEFDNVL